MHLIGIKNAFSIHRNSIDVRRPCAACNQDLLAPNLLHSFFVHNLNRMRIGEVRVPFQRRYIIPPQLRLDHVHFPRHHRLRPQYQVRHRNPVFHHVAPSVERPLPQSAQIKHGFPHHLTRDRSGMNANPAHRQPTVDNRDFLAHFRRANRALLSRRTAPDHYQVVFVCLHNVRTAKGRT